MNEISIFVAQFSLIYLLAIQQQNITGKHHLAATITSLLLGLCGWTVTSTIAAAHQEGLWSSIGISFLVAGPLAVNVAMTTHSKVIKFLYGRKG